MATPDEVLDGDTVLIHSPDTSGLVYSKSFSSNQLDFLSIESQQNSGFILEFAAFCIIQRKRSQKQSCQNATSQLMEIVYGSTIKLQHSFSCKYLTVVLMENKQILCLKKEDDENNNLFKIVPFHQEKGWGESLKVDDRFKLESMSCKGQKIKFQHKPDEKCYRPGLDNDGTMFYIEFHCHNNNNAELDPNCIKGGSIVTLASTEVDGYLSARGSLLTCETPRKIIKEYKIGLRRWQRGFFNTKPNSGDTFFQLESIDAKTNKGSNLLSFGKCRIKHLATQQYISATKDEEIKLESNASLESVQFEILTLSDKKEKEICYSDKVALMHTATKKFLSFNAILEEGDLIHWSDLILKEETASFKAIQVDEVAVQDAYQIVGMSSALYEVFEKMGTNDEAQAKVVKIMEELQDLFFSASNENPSSLKKIFDTPQRKTRLANMLRTCQMIDVMIVFLREEVKKDGSNLSLIESICSSLQLYVENGSERSMQYLVKEKEFLMDMVGKCSNADEVLITLFNKYKAFDHKDCTTLIEKIGIEDSEVLALMCTLAFNGRSIDWSLYKNINEKLKGKISEDVHQTLEGFATEVQYLDKNGTTTFTICSTCVCLIIEASNRIIEAEKYSQAPLNYGQSLKRCIQEIEKKNQECLVLVQLMNVLVFLIDYGVVDKSMEKDFTKSIMKLSGKTGQGHQCSAAIIVKIRKLALLSLKLLLQQNFDASFKVLLNDFCYLNNTISETDHDLPKDSSNIPMSSIGIQSQPDECPPKEMEMLLADKEITDKQVIAKLQARLKQNFNCFSMFNVKTDECQKLCRILIDGFADDDTKIRIMSAELLYGIFSVEETILSETAERTYFTLNKELYTEMKRLATMTDEDQLLRKMLRRELTPDSTDNLQKELERIADVCVLEDGTPNTISQNIGYSCGLFNIVLECVLEQKGQKNYEILKSCFTLLRKMSRKNKKAQNKLFISFHDFLQIKTKEMMRPMICLLNEIFYKNPDICQKLTEADIDNIFNTAVCNIGDHMELTVTLQIIIESTNPALPLKEHVARLIQHHSKNGALSFILEKDTRKHLIVDGYTKQNHKYRLLINITHLLATCCTGECQVAESAASEIYSIDELLEIITEAEILSPAPKISFIRVLIWTYLITENDSASTCSKLASNKKFWDFMTNLNDYIEESIRRIENSSEKEKIRVLRKEDLPICILTMDPETDLAKITRRLLYIVEGVIPLLSGLCQELSLHIPVTEFLQLDSKKVQVAKNLITKLMYFYDQKVCSVLEQMQEMKCIKRFNSLCELSSELNPIEEPESQSDSSSNLKTDEDILNEKFQTFIVNYDKAYDKNKESRSTLKELLKFFADEDYNRRDMQSLKVYKLVLMLRTLIERQKELGLHCFERTNLEKMTLTTLQLLHGIVHKKIFEIESKKDFLKPPELQKEYEDHIKPIQTILLDERADFIKTLFELLHHPNDDITYQVLACLDVLLYLGNEEAQKRISDINEEQDQSLIMQVQKILRRAQISLNKAKMQEMSTQEESSSLKGKERSIEVDDRITVALDVLVWICDGQQKDMQDALSNREKLNGTGIVSQVSFLLLGVVESLTAESLKIAQRAVQALIEMCAGNYKNQEIAIKSQVIISINSILEKEFSVSQATINFPSFLALKLSSLELLNVMLEEIDEQSSKLASWIMQQLSLSNLLNGMLKSWDCYLTCRTAKRYFCSETPLERQTRNSLLLAYHTLRRISDYEGICVDKLVMDGKKNWLYITDLDSKAKKMWQHCKKWSKSIEVFYRTQNNTAILTRVFFPCNPHKHLNEKIKDTLLNNIKRDTPQEKLVDLLEWTKQIKLIKKQKKKLKKFPIGMVFSFSTIRHYALLWLTILLNLIVIFSLRSPIKSNNNDQFCSNVLNETCNSTSPMYFQPIRSPDAPSWYMPVRCILGSIHLLLSIWMAVCYFFKERKNIRWSIPCIQSFCYQKKKGLLRRRFLYQIMSKLNQSICCGKISANKPHPKEYFQILLFSFDPLYRLLFPFLSIAGLVTNGYFYCGCMIYPFIKNTVLSSILRALRKSAYQLIIVLLLCFVFIYIYAVISFALLQNYFSEEKDEFCSTLFQCFVTVTRLGLLHTLGLGLELRPSDAYEPNFTLVLYRTVYDIIFFVVVTTLGLNIVIAILVDRFSEMREEKEKIDNDNTNRCLVCSIKKDDFKRNGQNFEDHIIKEHSAWDYIHFMFYLDKIHKNDFNALEKYVSRQVAKDSIDFFPMLKAKSLPDYKNEE